MDRNRVAVATAATATALAVGGLVVLGPLSPGASAAGARTLHLTNQLLDSASVGGPPPAQVAGGSFFVYSEVVAGGSGHTAASCVLTTTRGAGVRQCEIDIVLSDGTITTRGLTDRANSSVTLVVTGGTGHYRAGRGTGTLQPTPTGSVVDLVLR